MFNHQGSRCVRYRYRMSDRCKPSLLALLALVLSLAASAGAVTIDTMSVDPPAQSRALALYLARVSQGDPWSAPNEAMLEVDAYLPRLGEEGHLRAIRIWAESKTPEYQVIHLEGDASVKQQVIARYLNAEQQAAALPPRWTPKTGHRW